MIVRIQEGVIKNISNVNIRNSDSGMNQGKKYRYKEEKEKRRRQSLFLRRC